MSKRNSSGGGFRVQRKRCATCIYRKDSTLDLANLEAQVADGYGGFKGNLVEFVDVDISK